MNRHYFVYNEESKHYAQVCNDHLEQFTSSGYTQTPVTKKDADVYMHGCEMCLSQTTPR